MHVSNFSLFFRPVYVVRGCVRRCSRRGETPSAPSGLVPLRGGTVLPSAWQTKGSLRPRAEFIKSPLKFYRPLERHTGHPLETGLCIKVDLAELLTVIPRERKRADAYNTLVQFLKNEYGTELTMEHIAVSRHKITCPGNSGNINNFLSSPQSKPADASRRDTFAELPCPRGCNHSCGTATPSRHP